MSNSRISTVVDVAVQYADRTDNYLRIVIDPTHGARLGVTDVEVGDWHIWRGKLDDCFVDWSDDTKKTKPVNAKMVKLVHDFREFANPVLNRIAASGNLNETDEVVFNLVGDSNHAGPSHKTDKIIEKCFSKMIPIGGGEIANHLRTGSSTGRDHIFDGADGAEISYTITDEPTVNSDPMNATRRTYTKAVFIQELGAPNKGKYMNYCHRWAWTINDKLSGPFNDSQSMLIP